MFTIAAKKTVHQPTNLEASNFYGFSILFFISMFLCFLKNCLNGLTIFYVIFWWKSLWRYHMKETFEEVERILPHEINTHTHNTLHFTFNPVIIWFFSNIFRTYKETMTIEAPSNAVKLLNRCSLFLLNRFNLTFLHRFF